MRLKTVFLVVAMFFASLRLIAGNETATVNFLKGYDGKYDNCMYSEASGFMLNVAKLAAGDTPEAKALDGVETMCTLMVTEEPLGDKKSDSSNIIEVRKCMDDIIEFMEREKFSGIVVDSMYIVEKPASKSGADDAIVMMVSKVTMDEEVLEGESVFVMAMIGDVSLKNMIIMYGEDLEAIRMEVVEKYGKSSEQVKAFDRIISGDNADIHSGIVNLDRMMDE